MNDLDLWGYSFARYSEGVSVKFVKLYMEGHQHDDRKVTETSVIAFCHENERLLLQSFDTLKLILVIDKELLSYPKREQELIL